MKKMFLVSLALFLAALAAVFVGCAHKSSSSGSSDHGASPADDDDNDDQDNTIPPDQAFLPPPPAGKMWTMIWHDEFDGTELDTSKWTTYGSEASPEPHRDGYWVKEATYLDGQGHLVVETYEKDGKYYDGCVDTSQSFTHTTGYYETKMKCHTQVGHWIAYWMDGGDQSQANPAKGEEIDIIEKAWVQGLMAGWIQETLHWGGGGWDEKNYWAPQALDGYHTYGLYWTDTSYTFYFDGVAVWTPKKSDGICGVPLPMIISDEIGNEFFDNGTIEQATLPDYSYFDYVRVFDLIDKTRD
jgi:beta-glucanase (GH16 family)